MLCSCLINQRKATSPEKKVTMPARVFPETYKPPITLKPVASADAEQTEETTTPDVRRFPETYQPPLTLAPKDETKEEREKRLAQSTNPRDQPDTLQDVPTKEEFTTMLNERFPPCTLIETNIDALRIYECPKGKKPIRMSAPHGIVRCACVPQNESDPWTGTSHKEISAGGLLREDKPTWANHVYFSAYPCDEVSGLSGSDTGKCEFYKTTKMLFVEAAETAKDADVVTQYLEQKLEAIKNPLFVAQPTPFTPVVEALSLEEDPEVLRELYNAAKQDAKFKFTSSQQRLLADLQLLIGSRAPQIDLDVNDLLDDSELEFPDTWAEYKEAVLAEEEAGKSTTTKEATIGSPGAAKDASGNGEGEQKTLTEKGKDLLVNKHSGIPGWAIALIALAALVIVIAIIVAIVRSSKKPKQATSTYYAPSGALQPAYGGDAF